MDPSYPVDPTNPPPGPSVASHRFPATSSEAPVTIRRFAPIRRSARTASPAVAAIVTGRGSSAAAAVSGDQPCPPWKNWLRKKYVPISAPGTASVPT